MYLLSGIDQNSNHWTVGTAAVSEHPLRESVVHSLQLQFCCSGHDAIIFNKMHLIQLQLELSLLKAVDGAISL